MKKFNLFSARYNNLKVGLLGGSFNPAHLGHLNISLEAIKYLNLDYVYWLVTPQNPLKVVNIKKTLDIRVKLAKKVASGNKKIIVSDIEKYLSSEYFYTSVTLQRLQQMHTNTIFVWLMGSDNLLQMHKWYRWKEIIDNFSICVFDRGKYIYKALNSRLWNLYPNKILTKPIENDLRKSMLYFLRIKRNPLSSEIIRKISKNNNYNKVNESKNRTVKRSYT